MEVRLSLAGSAVLLGVALALALPLRGAAQAQWPNGQYVLSEAEWTANDVLVTVTVLVVNPTGELVLDATVSIPSSEPSGSDSEKPIVAFKTFDLRAGQSARLSERFLIPASEYVRWQNGYRPSFSIFFHGDSGVGHQGALPMTEAAEIPLNVTGN